MSEPLPLPRPSGPTGPTARADRAELVVILGNTGGGKSELAVDLAEQIGGEVIGADSMQVYREMDAGTAKPTASQRRRVPHHLIDVADPAEPFTVHDWLRLAREAIEDVQRRGGVPIVVGGTHLYLKALLDGLFDGPPRDEPLRQRLAAQSADTLHRRLSEVDPAAAERVHVNDRQRLVRAIEVFEITGKPISQWQTQWDNALPTGKAKLVRLDWETEAINRRINQRVREMFEPEKFGLDAEPLPDEARRLDREGRLGPQARQALGYKQVLTIRDPAEAFERTKVLTRRFAKQQRTWMKRFAIDLVLPMPDPAPASRVASMLRFDMPSDPRPAS